MIEDVLTEASVRAAVPEPIFLRGDAYCTHGAVLWLARRGETLHAAVEGSEEEPYRIQLRTRGDRILAECTCPYFEEYGEWCKHVVATMLALVRGRPAVATQPTVQELLAPLDQAQLRRVVEGLVDDEPWLYEELLEQVRRRARRASRTRPRRG